MLNTNTFLLFCWVCNQKFGPELAEERHHIIPKAFGGVDGPQVSLCSTHHSRLHEVGLRVYKNRPFADLLSGDKEQDKRLVYLGQVACNARIATENDPNKHQLVVFHMRGESKQQIKDLKKVYGRKSMQTIMELALKNLHGKYFLPK